VSVDAKSDDVMSIDFISDVLDDILEKSNCLYGDGVINDDSI
jgi:hypothetical protein